MVGRYLVAGFLTALLASNSVFAAPAPLQKRNPYSFVLNNPYGDTIFELGNVSYLANTKHPKAVIAAGCKSPGPNSLVPVTVVKTNVSRITKDTLEGILSSYLEGDDVFNYDFLDGIYISSTVKSSLDALAADYLKSLNTSFVFLDKSVSGSGQFSKILFKESVEFPAGPYLASIGDGSVTFATVYRLYADTYRTFLFGAYAANDGEGNHYPLGVFLPKFWDPMIP
jgi:hypothetical protein